jgi:hypothetical protein
LIQTRDSTGTTAISNDYIIPADASGATDHIWRIANAEKARLNSAGLTVVNDLTISDKIIHAGDTNTAIRFPAADIVSVETAGFERARITSAGLVGIGTNSPSTLATLNNTTPVDTTNAAVAGQLGNLYLEMSSGGTQGSGNLGPSINFTGINQSGVDGRKAAIIAQQTGANSSQVGLSFWTNNTADSLGSILNRMVITSAGNVGIGTTSPATTLDVNGDVTISDKIIHAGDTDTAIRFPAAMSPILFRLRQMALKG